MQLSIYTLEEALNLGWKSFAECFEPEEVGIKQSFIDRYWPKEENNNNNNVRD